MATVETTRQRNDGGTVGRRDGAAGATQQEQHDAVGQTTIHQDGKTTTEMTTETTKQCDGGGNVNAGAMKQQNNAMQV